MKKAFTIIELIIALIIFGIGLLMIILTLNKNVSTIKKIELKTKATLIAKDQIAIFYNFRDSNNIKYQKWNYITGTAGYEQSFEKGKSYKVWTELSGYQNKIEQISHPSFLTTRLYYATGSITNPVYQVVYSGFYLTYKNTGIKTPYARWISLTGAYIDSEISKNSDEIIKLISIVKYKHGAMTGEVILESFISNWK